MLSSLASGRWGPPHAINLPSGVYRVLGLEQFNIPHSLGSHHGQSRMIRLAYFEHPDYVPLLRRTYELWQHLQAEADTTLLHITGGLYLGPSESKLIGGAKTSCQQHKLPYELLSHDETQERFPQFLLPTGFRALYESQAGFLLPQQSVATFADQAIRHGAEFRGRKASPPGPPTETESRLKQGGNTYRTDKVVFTAGAWNAALLGDLGIELSVTRQVLGWFAPQEHAPFASNVFPVWFMETTDENGNGTGDGFYGFPLSEGKLGFKVALHARGEPIASATAGPAGVDREIPEHDLEVLSQFLDSRIPLAAGPLLSACVCFYTYSPDAHFIVDTHPLHQRVTIACGFSGHGFKFSAVMGEVLADLVSKGKTDLPIEFLGLNRFR